MRTEAPRSRLPVAALAALGLLLLVGVAALGSAWRASEELALAGAARDEAQVALEERLQAQRAAFEQVEGAGLALSPSMRALSEQVREAERPRARAAAAGRLSALMSQGLSSLPPAADDDAREARSALSFELIQAQERLAEAAARAEEAEQLLEERAEGADASLARRLGWAPTR